MKRITISPFEDERAEGIAETLMALLGSVTVEVKHHHEWTECSRTHRCFECFVFLVDHDDDHEFVEPPSCSSQECLECGESR